MSARSAGGRPAAPRDQAPTRRAALAGVILAGALLVVVAVAALWTRPASVPTYPADAWTGTDTATVQTAIEVRASGPFSACPMLWLPDGTRAGALLADGWAASIPGLAFSERLPVLRAARDGLRVGDSLGVEAAPIQVHVLDTSAEVDAALARLWTDACGDGGPIAMVAPDAVLDSLALAP